MKSTNFYLHDDSCEKAVIGTVLTERDAIHQVGEIISPDSFYNFFLKDMYCAALAITNRGDRADMISIMPELTKMGVEFKPYEIAEIAGNHTFDLVQYACRLADLEKRRRFYEIGQYLIANGSNESVEIESVLQSANDKLSTIFGDTVGHIRTAYDYLLDVCKQVDNNINGVTVPGTPTGFSMIDDKGGFQPTNLIVLAGESSQGKTALANAITLSATKSGSRIAFYSMEMSGQQLMTRLAAMESGIPVTTLANGKLSPDQLQQFDKAVGTLSKLGIYFDDRSTSSIDTILSSIRSMVIKHGIQGAIVDYMQILTINKKGANVEESIAEAARRLKNIAKELNIWILALSQLSRDTQNPVPSVNRLRGSGQINEAADATILIYRPEYYGKKYPEPYENTDTRGTALIDIAKGRNTGVFKFIAGFNAPTTHFYDLQERPLMPFAPVTNDEPF